MQSAPGFRGTPIGAIGGCVINEQLLKD